ncbi:MAG: hypothetical protein AAB336_13070 [Acidobacteriota bacterium]
MGSLPHLKWVVLHILKTILSRNNYNNFNNPVRQIHSLNESFNRGRQY